MADRWLTFDCFGTLIDWRHGIRTTGELLFPGRGQDFLDTYIALEAEVESEGSFKRYRAVLTETTRRAAKRLEVELKPDDATALVSTIPYWPPFHDIKPTHELGITRIWVNRQGERDDPSLADAVIRGLAELPGAISEVALTYGAAFTAALLMVRWATSPASF